VVRVLTHSGDDDGAGAEQGGEPLLGLEAGDELGLASGMKGLRRIDILDPNPLTADSDRVAIDDGGR
jgi:hypothetical protein